MTFGLVELAVGVILILVPGPGVSGRLPLFGIDSVVVLALDVVSLVVDILVISRAFLFRGRLLQVVLLGEDFHLLFHYDEPCELVCVGRGGSWPASRPAPPVLPNRGFLLPRSWVFRRTRPAERTGFAFFLGGCQHRRPSDRTGRLYPGRCARFLLLRCSRAMGSGIASLFGVVAWASDSELLFVEPSGVL
ncbi:hypothetical protein DY000_02031709 [Brassica cretica]|uniref:Uncharacterized protein n=1 Tax=Brassica cretica TaxID=69181 RepID=A0ABQ7DW01_BRACR|nr:hypothetical protein DY000_02031709 [Brassica cretica]